MMDNIDTFFLQMFNLFDTDGNGTISIAELLNMMAFFIEIGMDSGSADMAMVMSEVFQKGDKNKDELLNKQEFISVSNQKGRRHRTKVTIFIYYY